MNYLVKHVRTFKNFSRYISTINIPDLAIQEQVYERSDYPIKNNNYFTNKTISIIGYGPQGRGQSLNLKDNKFNVNIGVREGKSYDNAIKDGWIPNKNLFSIPEAIESAGSAAVPAKPAPAIANNPLDAPAFAKAFTD